MAATRRTTRKPKATLDPAAVAAPAKPTDQGFPIVGIGASAGGLAAFEAFFAGMPADADPGMSFVLVQHLAPDHKSILTDLIRRYTRMQDNDAVRIDETPPAVAEDVRKVVVLCNGAAKAREIGERGVGGERKNEKDGAHRQVIEEAFAENSRGEHGENALVPWLSRIGCRDAVEVYKIRNSRQQQSEKENNNGQGSPGVFHRRLTEGSHPVAHGLHAG